MTEINTLRDDLKMRNKILDDNQVEINKLKEKVQDQTNLRES